jgi:hypothetical protein
LLEQSHAFCEIRVLHAAVGGLRKRFFVLVFDQREFFRFFALELDSRSIGFAILANLWYFLGGMGEHVDDGHTSKRGAC